MKTKRSTVCVRCVHDDRGQYLLRAVLAVAARRFQPRVVRACEAVRHKDQ